MINRRHFLASTLAASAVPFLPLRALAFDPATAPRLTLPPMLDVTTTGRLALSAMTGQHDYGAGVASATLGFSQPYLGPTIRMANGPLGAEIANTLAEPTSLHWHGLMVPGEQDGGPHLPIAPGTSWTPDMQIEQEPATLWYHAHMHGKTAPQVYSGLAGVIHMTDGRDDDRGLPSAYGVDDLTLVLQDRRFDDAGRSSYAPGMMDQMHGFAGNVMTVNGQTGTVAAVPKGITRLRLVNGSNARVYTLHFEDARPLHLVATDAGYLPAPIELAALILSPGERAEVLVDFSAGGSATLLSDPGRAFIVQDFMTDDNLSARITSLPQSFGSPPDNLAGSEVQTRTFTLDMEMGNMAGGGFGINRTPYDMGRIDFEVALGSVERWIIQSSMMAHPFHVHGVKFQVIKEDGLPALPQNSGWKDTTLVTRETEILVRFDQPASPQKPFMLHCHILEHEDAGMMAQFAVI